MAWSTRSGISETRIDITPQNLGIELVNDQRSLAKRVTYDLSKTAAQLAGTLLFQIRCGGQSEIPADGGGLICSNHQSWMDPVLVGMNCHRRLNYLARDTLFETIPFRWLIQWYDAIPIQRDGFGIAGIKETLRRLKRGELVLVFPEGTRTVDGEIGPMRPGICTLARRAKVPLVPVAIAGAYQCWPRGTPVPRAGVIWVEFGTPIGLDEVEQLDDERLLARLDSSLRQCYERARQHRQVLIGGDARGVPSAGVE